MKTAVEARNLTKVYGDKTVVDAINFKVAEGECFGILGPNGAGKTSTMRMSYCSSPITSGELYVLGWNVKLNSKDIKQNVGVIPQEDGLDPDFNVLDNLLVFARYYGIPQDVALRRAREQLRHMNLDEDDHRPVETLSGGMKRRLVIARGLLNDPKLLYLDEPTTGLDPQARYWIWDALAELKQKKKMTMILTTHYMEEAERLCDRIAIMDKGKILCEGKPKELIRQQIGKEVVEFEVESKDLEYHLNRIRGRFQFQVVRNRLRLYIPEEHEARSALGLVSSDNIIVRKASLDDVFLRIAGHDLRD